MSVSPVYQVMTANRLTDGLAVYCRSDGSWSPDIALAAGAHDDAGREKLHLHGQQSAEDHHVVDPYFIDAVIADGLFEPVRLRERIRASGPTVALAALPSQAYAVGD